MFNRDTSITATAEITSKYHFAAHMGQLISGIEGTGCHNFYPDCPLPGFRISQLLRNVRLKWRVKTVKTQKIMVSSKNNFELGKLSWMNIISVSDNVALYDAELCRMSNCE